MPSGGKRQGAGRPKGVKNALPQGAVSAIRALRHRIPEGTPAELADAAGEALETVAEVMRGTVKKGARDRLTAAAMLREEICGPVPKKHELTGKGGAPLIVEVIRYADAREPGETSE